MHEIYWLKMIILLSPSKTKNFDQTKLPLAGTFPEFLDEAAQINKLLKGFDADEITRLLKIGPALLSKTMTDIHNWNKHLDDKTSLQAIIAYSGDVYDGFSAHSLDQESLLFAQKNVRIFSALYGISRPLDLIQAYRLDMANKLNIQQFDNLYRFWEEKLSLAIQKTVKNESDKTILNLASDEYFKVIGKKLNFYKVISPIFFENAKDNPKSISFYNKRARGMMANWVIKHRITHYEQIIHFDVDAYQYSEIYSKNDRPAFIR